MTPNVKIISEIKDFISKSAIDPDLRSIFISSPQAFSRTRKLGFERLIYLLLNFLKKSYSIEISKFYDEIESQNMQVSKSAFCQQRMKVNALFFDCLNEVLVDSFYRNHSKEIKRWKGFRLIAIDGSTTHFSDKADVAEHFGLHYNQNKGVPMGQIVSAFDVLNQISIRSDLFPTKMSEQKIAQRWLPYYDQDMLLIYDRGYPGFISIFLHQNKEAPQPFLMRCPVKFTHEIKDFLASDKHDIISVLRSNQYSSKELLKQGYIVPVGSTVEIRLIKVILDDGTPEILVTNLMDSQLYPTSVFKELYFKRWAVETRFNTIKNQLQMEAYSGQKTITIMQDFYITFFLANLQEIIAKPCENQIKSIDKKRKYRYRINRNIAFGLMKNRIIHLFISRTPEQILSDLENLFMLNIEPVRPNRKYERNLRANGLKSKYSALTNYKRAF